VRLIIVLLGVPLQELPSPVLAAENRLEAPSSSSSLETEKSGPVFTVLDGQELNDIPAVYRVPTLQPYELAAVGVWIDKRIVPGFRYRVRAIESEVSTANDDINNAMIAVLLAR